MRGLYYAAAAAVAIAGAWIYLRKPASEASNSYVDSAKCVGCHVEQTEGFRKTGMGRSFARITPQNAPAEASYYHAASDTHFSMLRRGNEVFQRRWQIGFDGKETNVEEKRVDYVMGSGNHSRTYLHLTSRNTLQQLPLHWYAENGGSWAMSPGYDRPDHPGSTRLAGYECMFCHNAYPQIPKENEAAGAEWVYNTPLPEGIDCQRCHGPGKRHLELASTGAASEKIRAAILNPKRLPDEQSMEICMQCHLHTTARKLPASMLRADRAPFSYVAGRPLEDFRLSFERTGDQDDRFENLSAAYRLRQSRCFTASDGELQCITCHNPHDIPRGEVVADYYNDKCQQCHPTAERADGADCIGCHMPKRRTDDEIHVVMTDHRIARHKPEGDLLAAKRESPETAANQYRGEVELFYPKPLPDSPQNSLDLARAQVRDGSNLADGLRRLESLVQQHRPASAVYYADLAEGYLVAGDAVKAVSHLEEAARRQPNSAFRLTKLGSALIDTKQFAKAEEVLRRAVAAAPSDPLANGLLGWSLWQQNKTTDARGALEKGIALDPDLPDLHNYLASLLGGSGDLAGAEQELRAALRVLAGSAEWQLSLARLLATRGALPEARYHFEHAVRLNPADAVTHFDYGRVLAAMNRATESEKQLREAVRLQPALSAAHLELAMALGRKNDIAGAVEHLRLASAGPDPQAKAAALDLLKKLGR